MCVLLKCVEVVGFQVFVLIVDVFVYGVCDCEWWVGFKLFDDICVVNFGGQKKLLNLQFGQSVLFDGLMLWVVIWVEIDWLCVESLLLLLFKGVMYVDDVCEVLVCGVNGFIVFNYGGCVFDILFVIVELLLLLCVVLGFVVLLFVDGGICCGIDVFKVMVFGVNVVLFGCFYVYVFVVSGVFGVVYVLCLLCDELEIVMVLFGCKIFVDVGLVLFWFGNIC